MKRVILPTKLAAENLEFIFDFSSNLLRLDDGLVGVPTVTVTTFSGNDSSPASMLTTSPTRISGTEVMQRFDGGLAGCIYEVTCRCPTTLGGSVALVGNLVVL